MNERGNELPGPARRWWLRPLFVTCVVLPSLMATLWFGVLASDVYVSESRFIVRGQDKATPTALGLLLNTAALGHGTPESSAAQSYLLSRDALAALNHGNAYAHAYARPSIARLDRFDPVGLGGSFEDLYKYYLTHVRVDTDSAAGITVLSVRAYTAADARAFNERLLRMAETTVNRMSARARQDLITSAQHEVIDAKTAARNASAAAPRPACPSTASKRLRFAARSARANSYEWPAMTSTMRMRRKSETMMTGGLTRGSNASK